MLDQIHFILSVGTDREILENRARLLNWRDYLTISCMHADEAFALAEQTRPDLVLLCPSLGPVAQETMEMELHRSHAALRVLLLGEADAADPGRLLAAIDSCFDVQR